MLNMDAIQKIVGQRYPPTITSLKEGTPYLNRKAFASLIKANFPDFKGNHKTLHVLFRQNLTQLPQEIKGMLKPHLKKWFIEILGIKGGIRGKQQVVPLIFLSPFQQQLTLQLNLVSSCKQPKNLKHKRAMQKLSTHLNKMPPDVTNFLLTHAIQKRLQPEFRNLIFQKSN